MARAAPQSQPYSRGSSSSSSSSTQTPDVPAESKGRRSNNPNPAKMGDGGGNKKLTSASIGFRGVLVNGASLLTLPLVVIHFLYSILKLPFASSDEGAFDDDETEMEDTEEILNAVLAERGLDQLDDDEYLSVPPSPALTTLLDNALYRAYQAELVPTVSAASRLLAEFISMKEAAALVLRECHWAVGVPLSGELSMIDLHSQGGAKKEVAVGTAKNGLIFGGGAIVNRVGMPLDVEVSPRGEFKGSSRASGSASSSAIDQLHSDEMTSWNEFDTIQDFAQQCYQSANEAIQRLTTDRLAESANRTLEESIAGAEGEAMVGGQQDDALRQQSQPQSPAPSAVSSSSVLTAADSGIGRCYRPQPRKDCWESPRLYCPDYNWADDAIGGCQRLMKALAKHRFLTLVATHGWDRYILNKSGEASSGHKSIHALTYASSTPHIFPSLEAAHSLQYLVTELLASSLPSRLNQLRAAAESNAVVTKRLYLVKCEYRAPMRALWESYAALNAAPRAELVERYLSEYHQDATTGEGASKGSGLRRKGSAEKSGIQQQREMLEKLITEKYWKHPALVEALQLERCCERMEIEMSAMLLPLSNLASEIMDGWKGRLRAVAIVRRSSDRDEENDDEDSNDSEENQSHDPVRIVLGYEDVPFMKELLRRLQSILRRKPNLEESTGIRPLLLDLQGVPRHKQDPTDSSIEMPFYPPTQSKTSLFERLASENQEKPTSPDVEWFYLEQFLSEVRKLLELLALPNFPCLVEERMAGSKGDKLLDLVEQCRETWDEDLFRAQFQDWFDMVKRQQELNEGGALSELSETLREAEIELSIAMASKDQLERVQQRLEALCADKEARYKVLRHIVFDLGYRELNDVIVVEPPADDATVEFPQLSEPGVFGDQLTLSGEVLPIG